MVKTLVATIATALVVVLAGEGYTQSRDSDFKPVEQLGRELNPVMKEAARNDIKSTTQSTLDRSMKVTNYTVVVEEGAIGV